MIKLPQLKHAALSISLAFQAGCTGTDSDVDQVSSTSSELAMFPEIKSSMNNKCLDILGFNNSDGAPVVMWGCSGTANQQWYMDGSQIKSKFNNKCLDILGFNNSDGARVVMWGCSGTANQQWYIDGSQIKSKFNNKCLDILGFNNSDGAPVAMWGCSGTANQQWY
jgi:O-glycosyl hydrolase